MAAANVTPQDILTFWFEETEPKQWWTSDPAFDRMIRDRFAATHALGGAGGLNDWEQDAAGALALVIVLDQFSRNIFRGEARAFEQDALARSVSDRAISRDFDLEIDEDRRPFFYMPFMHSEHVVDQDRCIQLLTDRIGADSGNLSHAHWHKDVIVRFGRFPFRNDALGRETTAEEAAWLAETNTPG